MTRKQWALPVIALAAAASAGWVVLRETGTGPAPAAGSGEPARRARMDGEVPRIDLGRLDRPRPAAGIGRRDLFDFGAPPPTPPPPPVPALTPEAAATPPPVAAPPPPSLPALNIKYIGTVESKRGLKVAVLMTERREVLTGQVGEVVAHRFKIVRIGLESVDVQEVGSEQVRRIPLKGN